MNKFIIFLSFFILINSFINFTMAENNYYIISIRRDENDKSYDSETGSIQKAINELVNERMNDIYDIIQNNQETFKINGMEDEKLNELKNKEVISRNSSNKKFKFINHNRPETEENKISDENLIPFDSKLVGFICPISNYYAVRAYLSKEIVEKVKELPNVLYIEENRKHSPLSEGNRKIRPLNGRIRPL
ncbi:hypothetical protein BCR32DRAFT_297667 [Anaeromyces robustus]|uniref:Inhibitor I9 domain-containing protein n=1 Tax=Anaeromyces robustus TaxID=1754192 RepID=A0A1Y1VWV7_9FUNG|nr:hypothetical protein BCR32DRAFT_297667 [Anaeromyces robustus]|eukprot:ORX65762.1 hypothetical protein BCR32DRAFT_297667 [Anaeromyces robustus]